MKLPPLPAATWQLAERDLRAYGESCARAALEEAAKVCEQSDDDGDGPDCWDWHSKDYSQAIRAIEVTQ